MTDLTISAYRDHDAAAVEALLRAAFGRQDEADLVEALRGGGAMEAEWVALAGDRLVGHLALSRMRAPAGWLCLAPLSVQPERQGGGIGTALLSHMAAAMEGRTLVVLGEPDYYARAGFSADRAAKLISPFPISHTLLLRPGEDVPTGALRYPEAFA